MHVQDDIVQQYNNTCILCLRVQSLCFSANNNGLVYTISQLDYQIHSIFYVGKKF